jgi:hypothetical protein
VTQDLFRPEAVEHSTQRLYGEVIVLPKIPHFAGLIILLSAVILLAASLLKGTYVQTQWIVGEISHVANSAHDRRITAQLFLPPSLKAAVTVGEHLTLRTPDVAAIPSTIIEAQIESIGSDTRLAPSGDARPSMIYVPVTLSVAAGPLDAAGLPQTSDYRLRIATELALERKSWFRWVLDWISTGTRNH